jgi:CheY-like chemotaxis protein
MLPVKLVTVCIEDSQPMRQAIRDYLTQIHGMEVLEAEDGSTGIELTLQARPNLVLLDQMLPDINGLEVCRRLRANPHTAHIPIIIISVDPNQTSVDAALAAGANSYVAKSAGLEQLVQHIMRVVVKDWQSSPPPAPALTDSFYADLGILDGQRPVDVLPPLKSLPPETWAEKIADFLRDPDRRGAAVIALAVWHDDATAPFNHTDGQRFFWGCIRRNLASSTAQDAVAYWRQLAPVARALMLPANVTAALEDCTRSKNPECRRWALRILVENKDRLALRLAIHFLHDASSEVRATAATALAKLGTAQHVPLLARTLNDPNPSVREEAALALACIGGNLAETALATVLLKGNADITAAAATALAVLATPGAVETLVQAAQTRDESKVLQQIAHALGTVKNNKGRAALLKLSRHDDESVRLAARQYILF